MILPTWLSNCYRKPVKLSSFQSIHGGILLRLVKWIIFWLLLQSLVYHNCFTQQNIEIKSENWKKTKIFSNLTWKFWHFIRVYPSHLYVIANLVIIKFLCSISSYSWLKQIMLLIYMKQIICMRMNYKPRYK